MGKIYRYIFMCLSFFYTSSHALIYELAVLKRWSKTLGRYQYFIGLSDFHDKSHSANHEQLKDLRDILAHCQVNTTKIGSEDISAPAHNGQASCGRFRVFSRGSILGGFTQASKSFGLPITNFEYRYCRVAALGPVLNNLSADLEHFSSTRDIYVSSFIKEIESVFKEILMYKDGPLLNHFYRQCIARVRNKMRQLNLYQHRGLSTAVFLKHMTTPTTRLAFLKRLLTFDSVLLDLRMLHDVVNARNTVNFLALAGGSHITCVTKLLTKLGYEVVHSIKATFVRNYNISRCLGSQVIDGKYCRRPQPIDVRSIKNFI